MKKQFLPFLLLFLIGGQFLPVNAQEEKGYEYVLAGGEENNHQRKPKTSSGIMLIGGGEAGSGAENAATKWLLQRADGGDFLCLRSGRNPGGQAKWIWKNYSNLLSSAAGLSINSREAANDERVIQLIRNAEVIFIAGGDQTRYQNFWKDTGVAEALMYVIKEKGITVAGTSVGMAILGEAYHAPAGENGVLSEELLNDPFHPNVENSIFYGGFLSVPYLQKTITDTHLNRTHGPNKTNRYGRLFGLLARCVVDNQDLGYRAIGADEGTFIAIDENGVAKVFGDPTGIYPTNAYFVQTNCQFPEQCEKGKPLIWDREKSEVKTYVIQGTRNGEGNSFDLKDWKTMKGGTWINWYTLAGYKDFNYANGHGAKPNQEPPSGCKE